MENQFIRILREKYLTNMINKQSLIAKKYFMEMKDRELREREEKIKREIIMPKDDMDKFEEQEMKKIKPIKRNLSDKLIKQNVIRNKTKIIRDKLKDKIIKDKLIDKIINGEKLCINKDFCGIVMPLEKDKILQFKQCKMLYMLILSL